MESLVANLDRPIAVSTSSRLGRMCVKSTVPRGHTGILVYNSFRSNGIRLFNSLLPAIRNITETDVNMFKQNLDHYLHSVTDEPCKPFSDNSIDKRIEQSSIIMEEWVNNNNSPQLIPMVVGILCWPCDVKYDHRSGLKVTQGTIC